MVADSSSRVKAKRWQTLGYLQFVLDGDSTSDCFGLLESPVVAAVVVLIETWLREGGAVAVDVA